MGISFISFGIRVVMSVDPQSGEEERFFVINIGSCFGAGIGSS